MNRWTCPPVEQQLRAVEANALRGELIRLAAAEDLLALVDAELAQMQQTLDQMGAGR
ncbi:hypothetical protein [Nonomuraea ceibae]|uniref:hypothetical protein n=1 Tax=Nonomuraea ceibae TaxID=1935170 RepID=UPI001C5EFABD|nr:hypothetical protein [Nonomuraea ceibae]